ncbi:MAG: cupin domain-containing protein [Flavobacteriaceae bacterium]|nr:cupin domain-containing protein [Muriicola sp.]MBT8290694.1 cupin domain-containing protein [Muriicola sp.]NNC61625.1 cupin domain-containing protein [Eudoraea sp.]NNK35893.1 cupin domain-containing protein [Eudoraea sp.]NNL40564.1 cupin domain-containing protein [Flavobacteriaceae bacterium]
MPSINNSIATQKFDQLQIEKLLKNDNFEILSISLEKGSVFPDHTSPTHAYLLVLEGKIEFHILGEKHMLEKLQLFDFPENTTHSVLAEEDSKFVIIR